MKNLLLLCLFMLIVSTALPPAMATPALYVEEYRVDLGPTSMVRVLTNHYMQPQASTIISAPNLSTPRSASLAEDSEHYSFVAPTPVSGYKQRKEVDSRSEIIDKRHDKRLLLFSDKRLSRLSVFCLEKKQRNNSPTKQIPKSPT